MIVLRSFKPSDLEDAFRLDQVCFPPGIAYAKAELAYFAGKPFALAIAAEKAGHMAGFLIAEWNQQHRRPAHLVTIDVAPAERRSGIATALMDETESLYRASGCVTMSLEVAVDNLDAQRFYTKRSFRVTGRRADYYNGVLDAFSMSKQLG